MNIKESWNSLKTEYKNTIYWSVVILIIDAFVAAQTSLQYLATKQCRNYMVLGSHVHACSLQEFLKFGFNWMAFSNAFIFLPIVVTMVFVSKILDIVFAKNEE